MVTEYGMSARLGAVKYGQEQGDPFLGRSMGSSPDYSHEVAGAIDVEVRNLIEAAHTEAWSILNEYRDVLDELATALLEKETLHRRDLENIFDAVEKRPRITAFNDFGDRVPSDKPPVKTPGELAAERGEPWPPEPMKPVLPTGAAPRDPGAAGTPQPNGYSGAPGQPGYPPPAGYPVPPPAPAYPGGATQGSRPDYGAPAGWSAPGWPPREDPQAPPPPNHGYGNGGSDQPRPSYPDQNGGYGRGQSGYREEPGAGPHWDGPNGRE